MNAPSPANDRKVLPAYAELHCSSNFSFLRGASHPEELIDQAQALGYAALALTDECSLAGVVRAHLAARDSGFKLIVGAEFKLADGPRLILLATDRESYGNLSELITQGRRAAKKGSYRLTRSDVEKYAEGCLALWLPSGDEPERNLADGQWIARMFPGRAWIAVELVLDGRDQTRLASLTELGRQLNLPLVATGDVHMHTRSRRALKDVLTAIRLGTTVEAAVPALHPNGERCLRARKTLAKLYPPDLLAETVRIAERCNFSLDELRYEYPEELVPPGETPASHLRRLTEAGLQRRWPSGAPPKVRKLVEHELALIAELRYEPYFLTVHDIVHFARGRGILCQGRGSAANSTVCFCLGITEVDPARIETLFERFISKERNEPPDIDVDFEHERREEVIQYLYSKYGRDRAALAATVIIYRPKSAVRDAGKALGFSLEQVDSLAGNLAWWDGGNIASERLREAGFDPKNPKVRLLLQLIHVLIGFPRHLSQHVGGFVIARDQLARLVPIENAAMPERTVIQWDKDDLDALGLLKVDVLGLGMLTAIRKSFDLVREFRSRELTMATIPPEDPEVYAMIQQADTTGVFQIESRAQMAMLPRLKPACFYDLVIEVAIMRPGPIQGDMVHPYLRRRQGLEPVSYPSDEVREVLERTLGVPIFQEQVIKLAMVAAGFTPGEADRLRRSMAAFRRRGGVEQFETRLIEGMRARGYSETFARQIFKQIEGFGEYGFPESHSASFALLVYVSAWLKRYEPEAFLCALLNSQPMGFYAPAQLVQDARRHGIEVRPEDVRASQWDSSLEPGTDGKPTVRLGLRLVKGITQSGVERLLQARTQLPFTSVEDLARRAGLNARDLAALANADALAGLSGHRHRAHWSVAGVEPPSPLLASTAISEALPLLQPPTEGENIVADYASLGMTLRRHPLALLRCTLTRQGMLSAAAVRAIPHGEMVRTAGLVICRQHPSSGNGVIFVTLEDETGQTNLIVWPGLAARQRRELLNASLLSVVGEVQREGEVQHVIARRLEDHSTLLGDLVTPSRDFR
ncbi:MAG TPA: error-prone DNA polymerase [Candidatus Methylomirabilis sp.]|nr:error-prone DNA polymerase [Candidatus Methylomirabilis sp.]